MRTRRTAICIIATLIACLSLFAVPIIAYASDPVEQDEVWMEAASFAELVEMLESIKATGGNIRLTANAVVEEDVEYTFAAPMISGAPIRLDTGEYSIIVLGKLILNPFIEITGAGGENGLLNVQDGGWLEMYSISVNAGSGVAIAQAPRSVLCYGTLFEGMPEFVCQGEIRGAGPVAVPWSDTNPKSFQYVYVRDGESAEDILPKTDDGTLYKDGSMDNNNQLNVKWDIDLFGNKLAERKDCLITGSYQDATAYAVPECMVVFQNGREVTVLGGWATGGTEGRGLSAQVQIALEDPQKSCRIDWSADGENWQECEADMLVTQGNRLHYALYPPDDAKYPFYISAVAAADGKEHYSNIFILNGPDETGDIGGNRGGGTNMIDPKEPVKSEPPAAKPPEKETPPAKPTDSAPSPNKSRQGSKVRTEAAEKESAKPSVPAAASAAEAGEKPSIGEETNNNKGAEAAALEDGASVVKENTVPEDSAAQKQYGEEEYPKQTVFQIALGSIISGAVIILAVTFNGSAGWGKKLSAWIKRSGKK